MSTNPSSKSYRQKLLSIVVNELKHLDRTHLVRDISAFPENTTSNDIYEGVYSREKTVNNALQRTDVNVAIKCLRQVNWADAKHIKVRLISGFPFV